MKQCLPMSGVKIAHARFTGQLRSTATSCGPGGSPGNILFAKAASLLGKLCRLPVQFRMRTFLDVAFATVRDHARALPIFGRLVRIRPGVPSVFYGSTVSQGNCERRTIQLNGLVVVRRISGLGERGS